MDPIFAISALIVVRRNPSVTTVVTHDPGVTNYN